MSLKGYHIYTRVDLSWKNSVSEYNVDGLGNLLFKFKWVLNTRVSKRITDLKSEITDLWAGNPHWGEYRYMVCAPPSLVPVANLKPQMWVSWLLGAQQVAGRDVLLPFRGSFTCTQTARLAICQQPTTLLRPSHVTPCVEVYPSGGISSFFHSFRQMIGNTQRRGDVHILLINGYLSHFIFSIII